MSATKSDNVELVREATRALVQASPEAMAVSMEAMAPWHQLVMEVWGLSARVAQASR